MSTRQSFAAAIQEGLGFPTAGPAIDVLVAVMKGEDTEAEWNPCATEEPEPGDGTFNTAGVKDYESEVEGVAATVATLKNGKYPLVLVALSQNSDAEEGVEAWARSPWGTFGHDVVRAKDVLLTVQANRGAEYGVAVEGPEPVPVPAQPTVPTPGPATPPAEPASPPAPAQPPEEVTVSVAVPQLQNGSSGPSVRSVQILLNQKFSASPALVVDSEFGPATEATVKEFQSVHHLPVDGVVGPQTWGAFLN